jgi:protein-disulfide isomerase
VKTRAAVFILLLFIALGAAAQSSQPPASPQQAAARGGLSSDTAKRIEAYLRHLYAWGPEFQLKFSSFRESPIPGMYEFTLEVAKAEQKDSAVLYVARDGQFLFRGAVEDMTKDPLEDTRTKLNLDDSPSLGPNEARVTVVEFADFECPACGELHPRLQAVLRQYPQVRFVYKDYPLSQIHPWARTASLAGRCVYNLNHTAFWRFYDAVYENQALISAESAWDKMMEYSAASGVDTDKVKACMNTPEAAQAIDASFAQGQKLEITSTPTLFVNGRRTVGAGADLLGQFISYDLEQAAEAAKSHAH